MGKKKGGEKEYNPGITCDKYLNKFAKDENCTIWVWFPSGDDGVCVYPK